MDDCVLRVIGAFLLGLGLGGLAVAELMRRYYHLSG